jgi:hypothetical protein
MSGRRWCWADRHRPGRYRSSRCRSPPRRRHRPPAGRSGRQSGTDRLRYSTTCSTRCPGRGRTDRFH